MADEFKKKYYDVLSNNPRLFARFFKEDSALTVSLPDGQQPASATGPEVRLGGDRRARAVQEQGLLGGSPGASGAPGGGCVPSHAAADSAHNPCSWCDGQPDAGARAPTPPPPAPPRPHRASSS